MKAVAGTLLIALCATASHFGMAQSRKPKVPKAVAQLDSVLVSASQAQLFVSPKRNLLTTHFDLCVGAGRVMPTDHSDLSFAGTVKGLYMLTGALYLNMGIGVTHLKSIIRTDSTLFAGRNTAVIASLPIGVGFSIGDDRAQIVNGVDFFPIYYVDVPAVTRKRTFSYGVGVDLGFHIRIRQRLHLGMMGKVQLFEPFDKNEQQSFPRYGFIGAGLLLRYD